MKVFTLFLVTILFSHSLKCDDIENLDEQFFDSGSIHEDSQAETSNQTNQDVKLDGQE